MSTVQANLFVTVGGDTGAMKLPVGTTAERPNAPQNGYFRFNTEDKALEYYANSQWKQIVGTKKGSSPASSQYLNFYSVALKKVQKHLMFCQSLHLKCLSV